MTRRLRNGDSVTQAEMLRLLRGDEIDSVRNARKHPEADFQGQIVHAAEIYGWLAYHTWNSEHSNKGFPDLELARWTPFPRLIKAEVKDERRHATPEQRAWLNVYAMMGRPIETYLWQPHHWDGIVEVLRPDFRCYGDRPEAMLARHGVWLVTDLTPTSPWMPKGGF